jgi:predicted small secreted protein
MMMDFIQHGARDPFSYVTYSKSYFNFVLSLEDEYKNKLKPEQIQLLELFSLEISNSKRIEESELLKLLLEQGQLPISDFKELLIEQQKHLLEITKAQSIVNNNYVQSNINNQFNLQLFLNDTCKDAMTIDDFISSLNPTIHDLEETGRLGYSAGITRIIVNGLKELDVSKRPIHCSDLKRETMFVKNTDKWERETDEKPILLKAVKEIGKKNIMNIKEWQKNNTHFNHYESKQNDAYLQIVTNSMSGGTEEEQLKANFLLGFI